MAALKDNENIVKFDEEWKIKYEREANTNLQLIKQIRVLENQKITKDQLI
jgi:hypothetical protein